MKTLKERLIGEVVAKDYRTAQIFRDFKMDFCCRGDKSIENACLEQGIETHEIIEALENLKQDGTREDNYSDWSLQFLTNYIINIHHRFARNELPNIETYAKKVAAVHGGDHPELIEIHKEFEMLSDQIISHMNKEEALLFPFIEILLAGDVEKSDPSDMPSNPIAMMKKEHAEIGISLTKIRELSSDFTLPEDACATYHVLFESLEGFEEDMRKHIHLENNVLFQKQ
jgi:regulator of cell morphogenesis and NO signaling